jgi:hypothetical protein
LKLGNLRLDAKLMQKARSAATGIFRDDPQLANPENQRFLHLIVEEEGKNLFPRQLMKKSPQILFAGSRP